MDLSQIGQILTNAIRECIEDVEQEEWKIRHDADLLKADYIARGEEPAYDIDEDVEHVLDVQQARIHAFVVCEEIIAGVLGTEPRDPAS